MTDTPAGDWNEESIGGWEAEDEVIPGIGSQTLVSEIRQLQAGLSSFVQEVPDDGWTDVEIILPLGAAFDRRSKVRFRRLKSGKPASQSNQRNRSLEDVVTALDLSRDADFLLRTTRLLDVVRSADSGPELRRWASRSSLFQTPVLDFLADSDAEDRFVGEVSELQLWFFELSDIANAFTVLVHSHARGQTGTDDNASLDAEDQAVPGRVEPRQLLNSTTLAQIILHSEASPDLRKLLARSELFKMSAQSFLEENDAESLFASVPGMSLRTFCDLADLVTEFTAKVHSVSNRR